MNEIMEPFDSFEATAFVDEALVVTVDGFEGPLDLLLTLARNKRSISPRYRS